jgi:hypothetical protein
MALLVPSGEARACGSGVRIEVNPAAQKISRAEAALRGENHAAAAMMALQVFPQLRTQSSATDPLLARAQRIMALASVRTSGGPVVGGDWKSATPAERSANLDWAVRALREQLARRGNDPALQTDLGEALSTRPATQPEALRILKDLAAKDLVASAHGYAALARLTGDKAMVAKCEAMTPVKAICAVPGA